MPSRSAVIFTVRSWTFRTSSTSRKRSCVSGPKGNHALLGEGDRRRLDRPDPDGQVPVPLRLLQQDDGAVGWHFDPDADDLHLPHFSSVLTCLGNLCWPLLPLPRYTRNRPEADRSPPPDGSSVPGIVPGCARFQLVVAGAQRPARQSRLSQRRLHQRRVQAQGQVGDLPGRPGGRVARAGAALAQLRRHDLLDQVGLPVRGRLDRPQVPGLHAVLVQRGDRPGDRERVLAVQPAHPPDQAVVLELGQLRVADVRGVEQLVPGQRRPRSARTRWPRCPAADPDPPRRRPAAP